MILTSDMAYIYSLALRVTDNVTAPIKVAICKSREVFSPQKNQNNLNCVYNTKTEVNEINNQSGFNNNHEITCDTQNDEQNQVPNQVIINVDGLDSQNISKKMERLYPPTGFIASYVHFFSDPTEVHSGLYLGSAYNAACWYTLENFGIKYIVNVTAEIDNFHEQYGITYYKIPIKDDNNESIKDYLKESYDKIDEFISKKDGNVLVHCYMGASRSATIVANYIANKTDTDVTDVISNLIERRPIVNPTQQLVADLIKCKM